MKLLFLFTNGAKFSLNLPNKVNRKTLTAKLIEFQCFCLASFTDHKRYASGRTTFKIPTHRPSWIGLEMDNGKVLPILDEVGKVARIKGYSILSKTGKGKDMVLSANPDFSRFIWNKTATLLGEVKTCSSVNAAIPVLDSELKDLIEANNAAKLKALPQSIEHENAGRKLVNVYNGPDRDGFQSAYQPI